LSVIDRKQITLLRELLKKGGIERGERRSLLRAAAGDSS
jgi:hypothetical protein